MNLTHQWSVLQVMAFGWGLKMPLGYGGFLFTLLTLDLVWACEPNEDCFADFRKGNMRMWH